MGLLSPILITSPWRGNRVECFNFSAGFNLPFAPKYMADFQLGSFSYIFSQIYLSGEGLQSWGSNLEKSFGKFRLLESTLQMGIIRKFSFLGYFLSSLIRSLFFFEYSFLHILYSCSFFLLSPWFLSLYSELLVFKGTVPCEGISGPICDPQIHGIIRGRTNWNPSTIRGQTR